MRLVVPGLVSLAALVVAVEIVAHLGVAHGIAALVNQQVLFGDIGNIFRLSVFSQQVIEGLVLAGADLGGNRIPPFFGVVEYRVDVKNDAAERKYPVTDNLADPEFCEWQLTHNY